MTESIIIENTLKPSQFMAASATVGTAAVASSEGGDKLLLYVLLFLLAVAILYGVFIYLEDKRSE